jgi:hypothetical protein
MELVKNEEKIVKIDGNRSPEVIAAEIQQLLETMENEVLY